jgi:uncharacterized protein (TIGR03118 family)
VTRRARRSGSALALVALAAAVAFAARGLGAQPARYTVRPLVTDRRDPALVNAWGLAASPTGPWWVADEARDASTLYSGAGRKQLLDVKVDGGPTGVAYYGGRQFLEHGGGHSDPARFVYACEDGRIRAWTPTVPNGWSARAQVVVDQAGRAAIFRGVTFAGGRLYATEFHGGRVEVFDGRWRELHVPGGFRDAAVPAWYAPSGIEAIGEHIFVTYIWRAPVDGNDAPSGGFVDEFDLRGNLVAHVARGGEVNEPWGLALAPSSFGRHGGDLLVAGFGDGRIAAYRRAGGGWRRDGVLDGTNGKPISVNGVWGIAFGNGGDAGARDTLFATGGPHRWRGASELSVHGLLAAIRPA